MWTVIFHPNLTSAVVMLDIGIDRKFESFNSDLGFEHLRSCVAMRIQEISSRDAEALRRPWLSHKSSDWPNPSMAEANGLNLNALFYSALEKYNYVAATMYLSAGADPLVRTPLGDCAARLGVAKGMLDVVNRPEWLDATILSNGETGLFGLACEGAIDLLKTAYLLGANPDLRNVEGETVLDVLDPCFHGKVAAAIADAHALRIGASTIELGGSARHSTPSLRRL